MAIEAEVPKVMVGIHNPPRIELRHDLGSPVSSVAGFGSPQTTAPPAGQFGLDNTLRFDHRPFREFVGGAINRATVKARSKDCNHLQADNAISDGDGVEVSSRTG